MVAWLSSIKEKDLNNCGKFVLTGDMSELSITKVDLSNMNTLEGKLSVWGGCTGGVGWVHRGSGVGGVRNHHPPPINHPPPTNH